MSAHSSQWPGVRHSQMCHRIEMRGEMTAPHVIAKGSEALEISLEAL